MKILMRNTVFKTAMLAGLFLCVLGVGSFPVITTSAHATHNEGFIHADEVGTDEDKLKQFVQDAVDAYYIDFIFREHCEFPESILAQMSGVGIDPATTPVATIKPFIPLGAQFGLNLSEICDYEQSFDSVFRSEGAEDGEWESDSIYLFVMDDQGKLIFHGADASVENTVLDAEDEGGRDVAELLVGKAEDTSSDGIVQYCWDDPGVDGDEILDSNGDPVQGKAPGDSWKISYVVTPAASLGVPADSGFPNVIFGSGIYPKTGTPPSGCDGDGMAGGVEEPVDDMEEPVDDMEEPMDDMEEPMDQPGEMEMPTETETVSSVSGGGCAIASGNDGTSRSTAFNLLLTVSALFLVASFGNRAVGRRNGNGF